MINCECPCHNAEFEIKCLRCNCQEIDKDMQENWL
jgi:hypothetical protein